MKIVKNDSSVITVSPCMCNVDRQFYMEKHGYEMSEYEINYYNKHTVFWSYFLKRTADEWLMVYDEKTKILVSPSEIEAILTELPFETELFFPYDKLIDLKNVTSPQISGTRLRFYWGSHIYFINRSGAEKMLKLKKIKQPLDETFLDEGFSGKLKVYFTTTQWFRFNELECQSYLARKNELEKATIILDKSK